MKPRRSQSISASLDSLLDTMTNVVGILVIILVLTILGVDEAVSRISEQLADKELVTQEEYDAAFEQAEQTTARLMKVRSQPVSAVDLTKDRQQLADLKSQLSQLKPKQTDDEANLPDPAALAKQLKTRQQVLATLQAQYGNTRQRSDKLTQQLAAIGQPTPTKPKQVTIPNPRTAPEGAQPVYFLCKGERIYEVPLEQLLELAEQRIKIVQREHRADRPPCKAIQAYFDDNTVKSRGVQLKVRINRNRVILRILPEEGVGETIEEIQRSSSKYKRAMLKLKRDENYARFVVWPDSYEAYLAARTLTDDYNLPAGWQPMYPTSIFEKWTPFICTPDKPLPPRPKPDPNAPDKPKPLPEPPID